MDFKIIKRLILKLYFNFHVCLSVRRSSVSSRITKVSKKVVCLPDSEDDFKISYPFKIGGADLSFIPENTNKAVCCYIVVEYREDNQTTPEVVWKDLKVVDLGK